MIKKVTILFSVLLICLYSCKKVEPINTMPETTYEYDIKDPITSDSSYVTDGFYHNDKKDEIFNYNNMYVKTNELKGKNIKVTAVLSFQGENRNTLVLGITTSSNKNLKGIYLMNSYIGKSNGLETFKYEKVEGDNQNEYFTFGFADDGKLTVTNLANKDVFIFDNSPN